MIEENPVSEKCSYVPSYNEAITNYDINIMFLNRGMIIAVGCQKIAFESIEKGMEELVNYTKNPFQTQEKWREILK